MEWERGKRMDRVRARKWKLERGYVHSNTGNRHDERRLAHAHSRKQHMHQHNGKWRSPTPPNIIRLECVARLRCIWARMYSQCFVWCLGIQFCPYAAHTFEKFLRAVSFTAAAVCFIRCSVTSVFQCWYHGILHPFLFLLYLCAAVGACLFSHSTSSIRSFFFMSVQWLCCACFALFVYASPHFCHPLWLYFSLH